LKGCNFVEIKNTIGEELIKERLVEAAQDDVQKRLFRKALWGVTKTGIATLGLTAGIGALDYYLHQPGLTHNIIEGIAAGYQYLQQIDPATGKPLIADIYKPWLLSGSICAFTVGSLGWWALNSIASTTYSKKNTIADAVLSVSHQSIQSELDTYARITHKPAYRWEQIRADYFDVLVELAQLSEAVLVAKDGNLLLKTTYPKKASKYAYIRPTLEQIVDGLNTRKDFEHMDIPNGKIRRVTFPLPLEPNQAQMYCEAYIFQDKDREAAKGFLGFDVFSKRISNTEWVIGSIGPQRPKHYSLNFNTRIKSFPDVETIKRGILNPLYYRNPPQDAVALAYITEATYPVARGGVSSVVHQMIRDLKPEHLNAQRIHNEVVPLIGFPGTFKTRISYDPTDNTHINPAIVLYGHTKNPSLDIKADIIGNQLFSGRLIGETEERYRSRELKRLIFDFEKAFAEHDTSLFYDVADRMQFFSLDEILNSKETLEVLHNLYYQIHDEEKPDFKYYQNEWRVLRRAPLVVIKSKKVEADVYYTLLTGVAGVYAALAKREYGEKFKQKKKVVLTEHGIFAEDIRVFLANTSMHPYLRQMWERALDFYSKITYQAADKITTLCTTNYNKQIRDGAPADKMEVIPVGIGLDPTPITQEFPNLQDPRSFSFGLLGNVQPVKRIELIIAVAENLQNHYGKCVDWNCYVMGRDDEDSPAYARQIHSAVDHSSVLKGIFHFRPYSGDYRVAYGHLDTGILLSASEVMPVAIIEFMYCSKIPIGRDVGAVDELINGHDNYGPAGLVLPIDTFENEVESAANAILALYLRKYYKLTGQKSTIDPPLGYDMDWLLTHDFESIGLKRTKERFNTTIVLPKYGKVLCPEVRVA